MKLAGILFAFLAACAAMAQSTAVSQQPYIELTVVNPKVEPARYSLVVRADGTGEYKATYTPYGDDTAAAPVDRAVRVHDPVLAQVFAAARKYHFFAVACKSPRRIAFTGMKTLSYSGPDGSGSCTFNYSRDKAINEAASNLMAVAYTLAVGARLASAHRYDRLSLDSELASLDDSVDDKEALEIGNIAPELESIANDPSVMNHARARAEKLLREAQMTR